MLVCQRGAACNGSLALIKALCLAGSLHHNLKMDCFAPIWVTIFCNGEVSEGKVIFYFFIPHSLTPLKVKVTAIISAERAGRAEPCM